MMSHTQVLQFLRKVPVFW